MCTHHVLGEEEEGDEKRVIRPAFKLVKKTKGELTQLLPVEPHEVKATLQGTIEEAFEHYAITQRSYNKPSLAGVKALQMKHFPFFVEYVMNPDDQPITEEERATIRSETDAFRKQMGFESTTELFLGYLDRGNPLKFLTTLQEKLEKDLHPRRSRQPSFAPTRQQIEAQELRREHQEDLASMGL